MSSSVASVCGRWRVAETLMSLPVARLEMMSMEPVGAVPCIVIVAGRADSSGMPAAQVTPFRWLRGAENDASPEIRAN